MMSITPFPHLHVHQHLPKDDPTTSFDASSFSTSLIETLSSLGAAEVGLGSCRGASSGDGSARAAFRRLHVSYIFFNAASTALIRRRSIKVSASRPTTIFSSPPSKQEMVHMGEFVPWWCGQGKATTGRLSWMADLCRELARNVRECLVW